MLDRYYTVKETGMHEIVIQKSRFIASVARVETDEEAIAFINEKKKQYKDATHNCSAYMIGQQNQIQKANDDGEPTGTAGVPILEVLKKKDLKDTVVVVTRYFGGIKLGAGGLIRAYSSSASEGINHVGVVRRQLMTIMTTTIDYTWLGKIENELRASTYKIKDMHYLDKVAIETYVAQDEVDTYQDWITELTNGQAEIAIGESLYLETEV